MALWTVFRQSKPKFNMFSSELRRCYALYQASCVLNQSFSSRSFMVDLNNHDFISRDSKLKFFCNVRFFAAPAHAIQKEEKDASGPRLNEQITTQFLRLVSDEGHKVISRSQALELAKSLKMDLVEVDKFAKPPVCKILDYHKEKYIRQVKDKERTKKKTELKSGAFKEVRFAAKIKQKDLQLKADMAKRLMESGHRVKCTAVEPTEDVDLDTLLSRFCALIKDIALEESQPQVEKKQAFVVVRHVKFGPSKRGTGKKTSKAAESTGNSLSADNVSTLTTRTSAKSTLKENEGICRDGMETDYEPVSSELLDENGGTNKPEWAPYHGADDFDAVFDGKDDVVGPLKTEESENAIEEVSSSFEENSGLLMEFAQSHPASLSMTVEIPKQGVENRYARDPRSWNPTKIPTAAYDRDTRNTTNHLHQNPEQGKQPQHSMNSSKQTSSCSSVQCSPINAYDPSARNPMDRAFEALYQTKKQEVNIDIPPQLRTPLHVEVPPFEAPSQDSLHPSSRKSPAKGYGIFSSQQVFTTPHEQSRPMENNRYSKRDPSGSTRNRNPAIISPYRNPPTPDLENSWTRS